MFNPYLVKVKQRGLAPKSYTLIESHLHNFFYMEECI